MTTKIIDTSLVDHQPKAAYRRASDDKLVFLYEHTAVGSSTRDMRQAIWNGSTWDTELIVSTSTTRIGIGGTGITDAGTEILTTSSYTLPFDVEPPDSSYNNPVQVWRKESGGSWSLDSAFPKPSGDVIFVPFGRVINLPGGIIRMTAVGWDTARTYAHVYYCDSDDDGVTWGSPVTIYKELDGGNECCYYADGDNHICVIRREDEQGALEGGVRVMKSSLAGVVGSWSNMGVIGATFDRYAAAPDLMRLNDGRMVMLFGDRGDIGIPFLGQQKHMSISVGQFTEIFDDINAWSSRIDVVDIFPLTPGSSGYGGVFLTDNTLDSTLNIVWMDSVTSTDRDIYQKDISTFLPATTSFSQGQIIG